MIYEYNTRVKIIGGTFKGNTGRIKDFIQSNRECIVEIDGDGSRFKIDSEYIQPISDSLEDLLSYLSQDEIKNIASEVLRKRIEEKADNILGNLSEFGSLSELIFRKVTENYTTRLSDQYEDAVVRKVKDIIKNDCYNTEVDYDDSYYGSIKYKLIDVTEKWIDAHKDEVMEWIKPKLKIQLENLSSDELPRKISDKVKVMIQSCLNDIIKESLSKE